MVWYGALCHAVHQHIGVVAIPALLMAEHRKTSNKVLLLHWWQVAKGRHFLCDMMKVDFVNFIIRPSNRGEMALYWVTRKEAGTVPWPRKLWKLSPGLWRDIHWFISCLKGQTVNLMHCIQTLKELLCMFNNEEERKLSVVQHWQIYFGDFVEKR